MFVKIFIDKRSLKPEYDYMQQEIIKDRLQKLREAFFREKYRFDQGNAFLVFINFSLLVITLVRQSGHDLSLVKYYIVGGLILTWLLGYFLDRFVRVQDIQEKVVLARSPIWQDVFRIHGEHNHKLEVLIERLEKLEKRMERLEKRFEQYEKKVF